MSVKDITSIFMSINFSTGVWTARKRDDKASLETIKNNNAKTDSGSFTKVLSTHWAVKQAHSAFRAIRKYHNTMTLPWDRKKNESIIAAKKYDEYCKRLEGLTTQCEIAVDDVELQLPNILLQAEKDLGNLWDPNDYPAAGDIKKLFYIKMVPGVISGTGHALVEASKETVAAVNQSIQSRILENQEFAMSKLWERLQQPVKAMAEKLSDPTANFHSSLIGNLLEVTGALKDLNLTNDSNVTQIITDIEDQLCGYSPKELKNDPDARSETAAAAKDLMEKMSGLMNIQQQTAGVN